MEFICLPFYELSLDQLYALLRLRQEVFIVEQNCPYLDTDGKDQSSLHLLGFYENELVAYTRIVPKGISYEKYASIGRVITSDKVRGKGFGKLLMNTSVEKLHQHWGKQSIKISAQSHLVPYYNSVGFESTGEEYLEDDIPHTAMVMSVES
ncbi:MAG: GNAT family N-acetyltransferase [Saprospiraceae bacterium]